MFIGSLASWNEAAKVLPAAVVDAVEAVRGRDLTALAVGRYDIAGPDMFFMIQEPTTKLLEKTRPEAHHRFADVQIVLTGRERYGVAVPDAGLVAVEDRLAKDDIAFYPTPANESFIDLTEGMFAVFLPDEFHRPCCAVAAPESVRKVVIKIERHLLGL